MPADAAAKLAELVQQAGRLSSLPDHSRDEKERELFGEVRRGLLVEAALSSQFEEGDMAAMLHLMVAAGQNKRYASRARESLSLFLGSKPWLQVAHRRPELLAQLKELLAADEATSSLLQDLPVDSGKAEAGPLAGDPEQLEELARETDELIRKPLLEGRDVMRERGWQCRGSDDDASAGFTLFSRAVTRLAESAMGKEAIATPGSALPVLAGLEEHWPDIIRFLASLYTERKILRSQVEACIKNLRALSMGFAEVEKAAERLPWAAEPEAALATASATCPETVVISSSVAEDALASIAAPEEPPGVPPPSVGPEESLPPAEPVDVLEVPPPAPPLSAAAVPVGTVVLPSVDCRPTAAEAGYSIAASPALAPEPTDIAPSAAAPAKASAPVEPAKPGIVWVDVNSKAWQTSPLNTREDLAFQGFDGTNETKPSPWVTHVLQHADKPSRVVAMIVNRRHKKDVLEISAQCEAKGLQPPQVIVCCRRGQEEEVVREWSMKNMQAVSDWAEAGKKALEYATSTGAMSDRKGLVARLAGYAGMGMDM